MPRKRKNARNPLNSSANLGFEHTLWQAAEKLRGHMDAAEYKHIVFGINVSQIVANLRATNTFSTLRNTLLPTLLSSEIRVKAAEHVVEAVL